MSPGDASPADASLADGSLADGSPADAIAPLARLVGTWRVTGPADGCVTYEWTRDRCALLQYVDLRDRRGLEIISWEPAGHAGRQPSAGALTSRFYSASGRSQEYTWDLAGDVITVWQGERGSSAYFRGAFSDTGDTLSGEWTDPVVGAVRAVAVKEAASAGPSPAPPSSDGGVGRAHTAGHPPRPG